jgi:hypothetical protein
MKITSREQAIDEGVSGIWDAMKPETRINVCGFYIERPPKKLEPLSDDEAFDLFFGLGGCHESLRRVIQAHDQRRAEIAAQETEEELASEIKEDWHRYGASATRAIAKVREHDAAKSPWRKQSEEPAPREVRVIFREPDGYCGYCVGGHVGHDDEWVPIPD